MNRQFYKVVTCTWDGQLVTSYPLLVLLLMLKLLQSNYFIFEFSETSDVSFLRPWCKETQTCDVTNPTELTCSNVCRTVPPQCAG